MAELFGKSDGVAHGRGGSMHLLDVPHRFMGGYGIVAGQLPLAVGAALAVDYFDRREAVLCLLGEGAVNMGAFHESLNLAALWRLPIIFICTNNLYAMGKRVDEDSAVTEIWKKACAYDMAAERVDGMDILAVHAATRHGVERARQEHRPFFLETLTYRYRTHSMADAGRYRTSQEVDEWRRVDPIVTFRAKLESAGLLPPDQSEQIEEETEQFVAACVRFAEESPYPDLSTLYDDVYCGPGPRQER
jgi:pyruvate dehydrogenase E1 component alpha subunit